MLLFPAFSYFFILRSNYLFPQHLILEASLVYVIYNCKYSAAGWTVSSYVASLMREPEIHTRTKQQAQYNSVYINFYVVKRTIGR